MPRYCVSREKEENMRFGEIQWKGWGKRRWDWSDTVCLSAVIQDNNVTKSVLVSEISVFNGQLFWSHIQMMVRNRGDRRIFTLRPVGGTIAQLGIAVLFQERRSSVSTSEGWSRHETSAGSCTQSEQKWWLPVWQLYLCPATACMTEPGTMAI